MPREIKKQNIYRERLLKLIPSEIVAAYIFLQGVIPKEESKWGLLVVTVILLILTPFYLKKFQKVTNLSQILITTLSFSVWVYSLGGPFTAWGLYQPWIGSMILVIWTLIVPLIMNVEPETG
jgi:hypothetical protein